MKLNGVAISVLPHELEKIDNEAILYTSDRRIITMNKIATFIWEIISKNVDSELTYESITIALLKECNLDTSLYNVVYNDVFEYIKLLNHERLFVYDYEDCVYDE